MTQDTDPSPPNSAQQRSPVVLLLIVTALLAFGWWYLVGKGKPDADPVPAAEISQTPQSPAQAMTPAETNTPPFADPESGLSPPPAAAAPPVLPPLPPLAASDTYLRDHWQTLAWPAGLENWLKEEFLIQRAATFVDGLAKGVIAGKVLPLAKTPALRPSPGFKVVGKNGQWWLDEANYRRYDDWVNLLSATHPDQLAQAYRWLEPLLESAYGELGQAPGGFRARLLKAIDMSLSAPDVTGPIQLKRESVFYQYVDPTLEALPPTQKLLLRMGPAHRQTIKQWLREFQQALIDQPAETISSNSR